MTSSSIVTRLSTQHSVFGQPVELPQRQLPTKEDVFRCFLWHRENSLTHELVTKRDLIKLTANDVIAVWNKASIPIIIGIHKFCTTYNVIMFLCIFLC